MPRNEPCRIVVTGIGLCTPLGVDRESTWIGLIAGRSATGWLSPEFWNEGSRLAGAAVRYPEVRPFRHKEPLVELALVTATESLADARLDSVELRSKNVGVVFGTSKGGLHTFSRQFAQSRSEGGGVCGTDPHLREIAVNGRSGLQATNTETNDDWLDVFPDRAARAIGQLVGGYGPVLCPVMACATGLAACLRGAQLIQSGDCDVVLAGSADVSLQPALLGSFRRLGVLSCEADDPTTACRPFDVRRSGFVIGEGAACLVLERLDSARRRGAHSYAEWLGGGILSDAHSLTQLDPEGASLQRLLRDLYAKVDRVPDYVNLHGTGTMTNDRIECQSIRAVFGDQCSRIDCSSLKGGLGPLLGAAGSVDLAATALSLRDQIVPPTVNLVEQDPECRLNLSPGIAISRSIDQAWKLSMGFGGHIAGVCLGRLSD